MKESADHNGTPERIAYLIAGFLRGTLSKEEHDELDRWIEASEENMRLFEELTDEEKLETAQAYFKYKEEQKKKKDQRYQQIKNRIGLGSSHYRFYIAAAITIGILFAVFWLVYPGKNEADSKLAHSAPATQAATGGITLTLSDGRTIALDSTTPKKLEGARVEKGEITYVEQAGGTASFNTLSVPKGAQYKVTLSDGTRVWLNCESSLTYPVTFSATERKVQLSGEGYFEVAHDALRPFEVINGDQQVTVLGTHFNVKGYQDETGITTTLLEGKVKVDRGLYSTVLKPGEQAFSQDKGIQVKTVDVQEETAWKNGLFVFRNATMPSIAAQIKRWYGVEIAFNGTVKEHFNATIPRTEKLEKLLNVLEGSGFVHFTLEGNKLVIQP